MIRIKVTMQDTSCPDRWWNNKVGLKFDVTEQNGTVYRVVSNNKKIDGNLIAKKYCEVVS